MRSKTIQLERFAYLPEGTFGKMIMPVSQKEQVEFFTVELPWHNNEKNISCVPQDIYKLKTRKSAVISRSTGGKYEQGLEVTNVLDRSYIMIHPANWPSDVLGCIGIGTKFALAKDPKSDCPYGVLNSRLAFDKFMRLTANSDNWLLQIANTFNLGLKVW